MSEPTGRTTDHASKLDSSHGGEHAARDLCDRYAEKLTAACPHFTDDPECAELTAHALTAVRDTELDQLRAELAAYRAAAQSTDLEGDVRDHLHGLADWDTPGGAAPEWLVDAVMGFVAPHVCARKQAEAERDTAQAAITRMRELRELLAPFAWTVLNVRYVVEALDAALTPPSAPESTEETDHG